MPTIIEKTIGTTPGRDFTTISLWLAACPVNLVTSDVIWKGVCFNDSTFNEKISFPNTITTNSTHYIWLTVDVENRHMGIASNGVKVAPSGVIGTNSFIEIRTPYTIVEYLEITPGNITSASYGGHISHVNGAGVVIRNNLCHGTHVNQYQPASIISSNPSYAVFHIYNNIVYDVIPRSTSSIVGISGPASFQCSGNICNNTVYNVTGATSTGIKCSTAGPTVGRVKNNVVLTATNNCFSVQVLGGDLSNISNNVSSDDTAPGLNSIINKSAIDNFKSISGIINLHLKTGSDCIGVGVDLDSLSGINYDIDGYNRLGKIWDIGADQYAIYSSGILTFALGIIVNEIVEGKEKYIVYVDFENNLNIIKKNKNVTYKNIEVF